MKPKKINCKWCGMGHAPRSDGNHWIVRSVFPAKIDIKECAYHKAGEVSPIQYTTPIATRTVLSFSVDGVVNWRSAKRAVVENRLPSESAESNR